jgi:hypothetical protein
MTLNVKKKKLNMSDKRLLLPVSCFKSGIIRIVVTVRIIWKFPGICTNSDKVQDATTSFQRKNKFPGNEGGRGVLYSIKLQYKQLLS